MFVHLAGRLFHHLSPLYIKLNLPSYKQVFVCDRPERVEVEDYEWVIQNINNNNKHYNNLISFQFLLFIVITLFYFGSNDLPQHMLFCNAHETTMYRYTALITIVY